MYITLQRAKTAREAIKMIDQLLQPMDITVKENPFQFPIPMKYGSWK